jgi:APA family basic amino acid/polyamine antiporter
MATATRPGPWARNRWSTSPERRWGTTGSSAPSAFSTSLALGQSGHHRQPASSSSTAKAIGVAGPSIVISFALAGVTCLFSALSYGELASSIPVSGSAYTYGYATLGELVGWIIGWDLILEYGVSVAAVAVGWGGYLPEPARLAVRHQPPRLDLRAARRRRQLQPAGGHPHRGRHGAADLRRARERPTNTMMVFLKVAILIFFIVVGVFSINGDNFSPWAPNGFNGTADAAALIFFAYIGFDAISTSARRREPKAGPAVRDHRARCSSAR